MTKNTININESVIGSVQVGNNNTFVSGYTAKQPLVNKASKKKLFTLYTKVEVNAIVSVEADSEEHAQELLKKHVRFSGKVHEPSDRLTMYVYNSNHEPVKFCNFIYKSET